MDKTNYCLQFPFRYSLFNIVASFYIIIIFFPCAISGTAAAESECTCNGNVEGQLHYSSKETLVTVDSLKYRLVAIASILVAGAAGVSIPLLARKYEFLGPEKDIFFMIKAFAAGVILSTGFVHILPDAFQTLTSPLLKDTNPWAKFPFSGLIALTASIATLMVDTLAMSFFRKKMMHFDKTKLPQVSADEEEAKDAAAADHMHRHGAAAAAVYLDPPPSNNELVHLSDRIRQRVVSQVLELGIVVHSVIIGLCLGTSQTRETIRPLLVALSFHQFFEGMGLGGCIAQAKFKSVSTAVMAVFFSLTTPVGIATGIGISSVYNPHSSTALITQGVLNSASAGILIYMALVDLLAADFMKPKIQNNVRLQLGGHVSLVLGAGSMSVLAMWA
ncbi:PREDICTED: zinc transporter 5-like [Ipomoea nil]|uniref:zinc transporter 5-like n=1 Tax=Ipomoea nil TaxID=35883 RepID=UPI000900D10D|nr:PREDICTED: zinc transporter 5-like [Ipomoea nil]